MANEQRRMETAFFGGGCFWCTEAVFQRLKGVIRVVPGYMGGTKPNPTYEDVCGGETGHAEVVKIEFDPEIINLRDLLAVFFASHDPTTSNRQGNDVGSQYTSVFFYTGEEQKREVRAFISELKNDGVFASRIITELRPQGAFYEAEDSHKNYYNRNSSKPYCEVVIAPKIEKLYERFEDLLK